MPLKQAQPTLFSFGCTLDNPVTILPKISEPLASRVDYFLGLLGPRPKVHRGVRLGTPFSLRVAVAVRQAVGTFPERIWKISNSFLRNQNRHKVEKIYQEKSRSIPTESYE
jgi:hypothetical protein